MATVDVVVGLAFGDEGKGTVTEAIAHQRGVKLVVRFNGGAQMAHHVVLPDGREHCFSQWGSGTFHGARSFLSRFVLVNPIAALSEARHLERVEVTEPLRLLYVDRDAVITTPFHVAANRLRELARGDRRHGSCGMGIGETVDDILRMHDVIHAGLLDDKDELRKHLKACQERKRAEIIPLLHEVSLQSAWPATQELAMLEDPDAVDDVMALYGRFADPVTLVDRTFLAREVEEHGHIIFEGAQGVLLDQDFGFQPHTTWSKCTLANANALLADSQPELVRNLGVMRTFFTRHGAGPLPTESSDMAQWIADDHNAYGPWQGSFRVGAFDIGLARYALMCATGIDGLVLTHMDKVASLPHVGIGLDRNEGGLWNEAEIGAFDYGGAEMYARKISEILGVPLAMTSWGKTWKDKREL